MAYCSESLFLARIANGCDERSIHDDRGRTTRPDFRTIAGLRNMRHAVLLGSCFAGC